MTVRELEVRILPAGERAEAERIWVELERSTGGRGVLCSWAWTGAWLAHFGDCVSHRFVVGEQGGIPCGVALLTRLDLPGKGRRLQLGTVGPGVYVEYNRMLVEAEERGAFAAALLRAVHRQDDWDELGLDGLDHHEAAPLLAADRRLGTQSLDTSIADLQELAGSSAEVMGGLPTRTASRLRRTRAELEPVELEVLADSRRATEAFDELAELHHARWAHRGGFLSDPRALAFHRDAIAALVPDRALLFRLRSAGQTIGCVYGLVEGRRLLFYLSGVRPLDDPRLAPGQLTHAASMQACLERGLLEYDFLAGGERYKRELSNRTRPLLWLTYRRRRLRALAGGALARARRRLRRGG